VSETPSERNRRIGRAAGHTVGVAANQRDAAIAERDAAIAERDRLRAALGQIRDYRQSPFREIAESALAPAPDEPEEESDVR
jgi:hypothetical protein